MGLFALLMQKRAQREQQQFIVGQQKAEREADWNEWLAKVDYTRQFELEDARAQMEARQRENETKWYLEGQEQREKDARFQDPTKPEYWDLQNKRLDAEKKARELEGADGSGFLSGADSFIGRYADSSGGVPRPGTDQWDDLIAGYASGLTFDKMVNPDDAWSHNAREGGRRITGALRGVKPGQPFKIGDYDFGTPNQGESGASFLHRKVGELGPLAGTALPADKYAEALSMLELEGYDTTDFIEGQKKAQAADAFFGFMGSKDPAGLRVSIERAGQMERALRARIGPTLPSGEQVAPALKGYDFGGATDTSLPAGAPISRGADPGRFAAPDAAESVVAGAQAAAAARMQPVDPLDQEIGIAIGVTPQDGADGLEYKMRVLDKVGERASQDPESVTQAQFDYLNQMMPIYPHLVVPVMKQLEEFAQRQQYRQLLHYMDVQMGSVVPHPQMVGEWWKGIPSGPPDAQTEKEMRALHERLQDPFGRRKKD